MNASIFLLLAVCIILSNGKQISIETDDDMEVSEFKARSFLENYDNLDCVPCKFNLIPCCKPNLCIKKRFRPDECLELRPRKS